jgi:hypothetical protein
VKLNVVPLPPAPNGWPFLATPQLRVRASFPGSLAVLPSATAAPSTDVAGAPVIAAVGATFSTATVAASVAVPPSPSVTVRVTT